MPLTSLYNAVKQNPVKTRTIQEIMQQNPEKKTMFSNSDIVVGKGYSPSASNSTSVTSIANEFSPKRQGEGLPISLKAWSKCKCLKELSGSFLCKKFQMKCVKEKCPQKFIEVDPVKEVAPQPIQ